MRPFRQAAGPIAPMDRVDVDTDQIIPKQFLKRVERTGYGTFLFHDLRYDENGSPRADFVLNQPAYANAPILVAGRNFGCGSSREHAAWALSDFGFRAILAPAFADIFLSNCYQSGLLPVTLSEEEVGTLMNRALETPGYRATVDLQACTVQGEDGFVASFQIPPFRRECLLQGIDDVDLTLAQEDRIRSWEADFASEGLLP